MMFDQVRHLYVFGPFQLDISERLFLKDGTPVALTPKAFDILAVLVQRTGHLVEKEELLKEVWAESFVEESNLTRNIYVLRKALGKGTNDLPRIETVPRKGYRFVADLRVLEVQDTRHQIIGTAGYPVAEDSVEIQLHSAEAGPVESEIPHDVSSHNDAQPRHPHLSASASKLFHLRQKHLALITTIALLLGAFAFLFVKIYSPWRKKMQTMQEISSIAILPFEFQGAGNDDAPLGLGITDSLISRLSKLKQFRVLPTSTVFKYKEAGSDPVEIGRGLGVDAVVTGTVQRDGERIRVRVQLIHVNSRESLWDESFETQGTDVFRMQDIIAERAIQVLHRKLSESGTELLTKRSTSSPEAYDAYLRGIYFWNKRTKEGLDLSARYFSEAIEKDPKFAQAYAGLADSIGLTMKPQYTNPKTDETYLKAKSAALKAIELDESLPEAHTALGMIYKVYELDPDKAEQEYIRALQLSPNNATAHSRYGILLMHRVKLDEAYEHIRLAYELDPLSRSYTVNMGVIHFFRREYDQAAMYYQRSMELEPTDYMTFAALGEIYEAKGGYEQAISNFTKALEKTEGGYGYYMLLGDLGHTYAKAGRKTETQDILRALNKVPPGEERDAAFAKVKIYVGLGEFDQAIRLLEQGSSQQSRWRYTPLSILDLRIGSRYDALRDDPRFAALMQSCFNSPFCR
jgi:DNA-binding winged helix-turn-helix (wHTH) protein/TolB-like protein/Tfp pilus assembly protein PilF